MINRQVFGFSSKSTRTVRLGFPSTVDSEQFTLIAPFTENSSQWYKTPWINVHDGRWFYLAPLAKKQSFEASAYILDDVVDLYHIHRESKSLAPDGTACGEHTSGLLLRASVVAGWFGYIGKETDRKWEQEGDLSMLFPTLPVYKLNESARLVENSSSLDEIHSMTIRYTAKTTGLSTRTVRAARKGKRMRKATVLKLLEAVREHQMEETEKQETLESAVP
jgi:hypothetical protein